MSLLSLLLPTLALAGNVDEADKTAAALCGEIRTYTAKAPSAPCKELKPFYTATLTNKSKALAACASQPKELNRLDEQKRQGFSKCNIEGDKKRMAEATAAAARGLKIDSPEVQAGQKAKESIHRCADLIQQIRDGNGGKKPSYVKTRNEMLALREENSKRHIKGNADSKSKNPACVSESIEYAKTNEKLQELVSALYQSAALRIESAEKEENSVRGMTN